MKWTREQVIAWCTIEGLVPVEYKDDAFSIKPRLRIICEDYMRKRFHTYMLAYCDAYWVIREVAFSGYERIPWDDVPDAALAALTPEILQQLADARRAR